MTNPDSKDITLPTKVRIVKAMVSPVVVHRCENWTRKKAEKSKNENCSVVSDSLQPHGLQHDRLPFTSLSPGVCSNSCTLSGRCHPTISSSIIPFTSCLQSFPASESFPICWLLASCGQSIGTSASASVLPMNIQGLFFFRIDWFDHLAV